MNFILFLARLAHLKFQEVENLKFELRPFDIKIVATISIWIELRDNGFLIVL
jgi:hypothetical protein